MAVNQNDLDLLQTYLDGELPVAESEGLWRRLSVERELAAELDQLRADQAIRSSVWSSYEVEDRTVARVEAGVMRAARRDDIFSTIARFSRVASVAAACILFGFTVGWLGRPVAISGSTSASHATPVSYPVPVASGNNPKSGNVVYVYDQAGNVVATKQFDSIEDARQFARDVSAAQSSPQMNRDSNIVPAMDHF